jgi:hypothetical protein
MTCSKTPIPKFCNCFTLGPKGVVADGLPDQVCLSGLYFLLEDTQHSLRMEVWLGGERGVKDKPFCEQRKILSARPATMPRHSGPTLAKREIYRGVFIFVDALRVEFPDGLQDEQGILIPGAIVIRKDGRHKDGYARAGVLTSWSKQQLCVLDIGDTMFVVDSKMRVIHVSVGEVRITVRQPTEDEMATLCKETELLKEVPE